MNTINNIPVYTVQNNKDAVTKAIKKKANGIGFFILIYFMLMQFSFQVLGLILQISGISIEELTNNTIPSFLIEIFAAAFSAFIPCIFYALTTNSKMTDYIRIKPVKSRKLLTIICIGMAAAMFANCATEILSSNFSIFRLKNTVSTSKDVIEPLQFFLYVISTAITPALAEEIAFRGIVMNSLRKYGDCFAIIASSVMFGAMHRNIEQIPFAFILGLILAYADCIANSILPSIIIHFINNFYVVVIDAIRSSGINFNIYISIYFSIVILFCVLGLISFMIIIKKDKNFFKITNNDGITENAAKILSLKEKCKSFFLSGGVFATLSLFLIEAIYNLGVIS